MTDDTRQRAYLAASLLRREELRRDAPERAAVLAAVEESDVIVVSGIYDRVEDVLGALEVQHTIVAPADLGRVVLHPQQLLVVNCPGQVSPGALPRIRAFVEAGGSLFTTDWALRHVVEQAFPGVLAFNERPTGDDVVRVEVRDRDDLYVKGVMDGQDDPQWWLEASSYPIRILDAARVQVLITSRELGVKYGEEPVAVRFAWGEGEVYHMISHYYLQRTEMRTRRHRAGAGAYFAEKGVAVQADMAVCLRDLSVADVESARASSAFVSNIVIDKKARAMRCGGACAGAGPTDERQGSRARASLGTRPR
jgi:hypothetical protein